MRRIFAVVLLLTCCAAALERQANQDYRARRERLAQQAKGGVILLFADTESAQGDAIWGFHQDNNFYYLTGWPEPGAALLIVAPSDATGNRPARSYDEVLFLPTRNLVQERWTGPKLGPENPEAARITGFARVAPLHTLPRVLGEMEGPVRIFTDAARGDRPTTATAALQGLVRLDAFPGGMSVADAKPLLGELRKVKDAGEIALLRKSAEASVAAHFAAMHAMKPGSSECRVHALMQYEFERGGCERPAYAPIVGAGFNSTVLHYSASSGPINNGDVVVLDVGAECSYYAMDITRTLPANGKFTPRQREIYDIVLGAQQAAISAFKAGTSKLARGTDPDSLYRVAYDYINTHGKDLQGGPLGKYFIHGLGHFVGLDVHDPGDTGKPLDKGMVFTLEPGIYIPEEKLGVRIEDTFLVGPDGQLINLSGNLPKTADELEREMAKR